MVHTQLARGVAWLPHRRGWPARSLILLLWCHLRGIFRLPVRHPRRLGKRRTRTTTSWPRCSRPRHLSHRTRVPPRARICLLLRRPPLQWQLHRECLAVAVQWVDTLLRLLQRHPCVPRSVMTEMTMMMIMTTMATSMAAGLLSLRSGVAFAQSGCERVALQRRDRCRRHHPRLPRGVRWPQAPLSQRPAVY